MNYAMMVGINNFQDPSSALAGCVNDTIHDRQLLLDNGWLKPHIAVFCDARATRLAQYRTLNRLTKVAVPGDNVFLQWSCHGSQVPSTDPGEPDGLDEVLCPYDYPELWDSPNCADADDCQMLLGEPPKPLMCDKDTAIFLKAFKRGVNVSMLVDACHSGTCDRGVHTLRAPAKQNHPKFIVPPQELFFTCDTPRSALHVRRFGVKPIARTSSDVTIIDQDHVLLSGCRDDQTSADCVEDGIAQGAMNWSFLQAVRSVPKITWIQAHIRMLEILKAAGYEQIPQLTGSSERLNRPVFN